MWQVICRLEKQIYVLLISESLRCAPSHNGEGERNHSNYSNKIQKCTHRPYCIHQQILDAGHKVTRLEDRY